MAATGQATTRPETDCGACGKRISYHAGSGHWNHINTEDAPNCQGAVPTHRTSTYEPCVLGSDGKCHRWSHDHSWEASR